MSVEFVSGKDHYDKVIERVASVKKSLWIGTADIKGLHVKADNKTKPFLGVLADLLKRGVEIRLIHAKEPGPAFREDFNRYPILKTWLEQMLTKQQIRSNGHREKPESSKSRSRG